MYPLVRFWLDLSITLIQLLGQGNWQSGSERETVGRIDIVVINRRATR
jgi:hypothetical protein